MARTAQQGADSRVHTGLDAQDEPLGADNVHSDAGFGEPIGHRAGRAQPVAERRTQHGGGVSDRDRHR